MPFSTFVYELTVNDNVFQLGDTNFPDSYVIDGVSIFPGTSGRYDISTAYFFGVGDHPFVIKSLHGNGFIKVKWILVVIEQCLVCVVIGFKIGLRLEQFTDRFSLICFSNGDHSTEWSAEIAILDLGDLTEAIWETAALVTLSRL